MKLGQRCVGWVLGLCAMEGCGDATPPETRRVVPPLTCADPSQLAVPSGFGMDIAECVTVGTDTSAVTVEWPAIPDGAPMPVRYVSARGSATSDGGSAERASSDLAAVAAALGTGGGTVLVARGELTLAAPAVVSGRVWVVGAGAGSGGATLRASGGAFSLAVGSALTMMHAAVRPAATPATRPAMDVAMGTTLTLDDVLFDAPTTAILAFGAMVDGQRVTVRGATSHGISVQGGTRLVLRRSVVRDGAAVGILAAEAQVHLREVLVQDHAQQGVALRGGAEGTAAPCAFDGTLPMGGPTDCLERVGLRRNRVTGLQIEGTATRTPVVYARRIAVSETGRDAMGRFGYGVVVGRQAALEMDREIVTEATMGTGSQLVANHGAALVFTDHAQGITRGARIASNEGPGVFVQISSDVTDVGYSQIEDNAALGVGVTDSGSLASVTCNGISATRLAMLSTTDGMRAVGDGVSFNGNNGAATEVVQNHVTGSARFGMLFVGEVGGALRGNTIASSRYDLGLYDTRLSTDTTPRPGSFPAARPPVAERVDVPAM